MTEGFRDGGGGIHESMEARGVTIVRQWPKPKEGLVRVRLMAAPRSGSALAHRLNRKTGRNAR
jgi:hypothetical protein